MSPRTRVRLLATGLLLLACGLLAYLHAVPVGVSLQPWLLASQRKTVLTSPAGTRRVQVYYNDAGAAHSGNHWTWLVVRRWWGRRVVAAGYSGSEILRGPFSAVWRGEDELEVTFLEGRRSERAARVTVRLR